MPKSGGDAPRAFRLALRRAAPTIARPLPWVGCHDPWAVLVSEVMLQQTPTTRVAGPWARFLERFPTPKSCADAPLADVLRLWIGLGYPRRAKFLHDAARVIRDEFGGEVPSDGVALRALPGVGEYTASAVLTFAFGADVVVLDTNVGRVLARAVQNRTLERVDATAVARSLLPPGEGAAFNQAMMDLGAQFCRARPRCESCPVALACRWRREGGSDPARRSAGVSRAQGRFEGSNRQLRGLVLRALVASGRSTRALGHEIGALELGRLEGVLDGLQRDGLIEREGCRVRLAGSDSKARRALA